MTCYIGWVRFECNVRAATESYLGFVHALPPLVVGRSILDTCAISTMSYRRIGERMEEYWSFFWRAAGGTAFCSWGSGPLVEAIEGARMSIRIATAGTRGSSLVPAWHAPEMWPTQTLQSAVFICPTAGTRAIFSEDRQGTEHSLTYERHMLATEAATAHVGFVAMRLFVIDGDTQLPVSISVRSSRSLDLPPDVGIAFRTADVQPYLRQRRNEWYFVFPADRPDPGGAFSYTCHADFADVPAFAAPSVTRLLELCRLDNQAEAAPRLPPYGGGPRYSDHRRLQVIALEGARLGLLRMYPSRSLFDRGAWLVLSAEGLANDHAHQHHYVGNEFPTSQGPRRHVFATPRPPASVAPTARPAQATQSSRASWIPEALAQQVMLIGSGVLLGLASARGGFEPGVTTEALVLAIIALLFILVAVQPVARPAGHHLPPLPPFGGGNKEKRTPQGSSSGYLFSRAIQAIAPVSAGSSSSHPQELNEL